LNLIRQFRSESYPAPLVYERIETHFRIDGAAVFVYRHAGGRKLVPLPLRVDLFRDTDAEAVYAEREAKAAAARLRSQTKERACRYCGGAVVWSRNGGWILVDRGTDKRHVCR
jgi:hypothetical protein